MTLPVVFSGDVVRIRVCIRGRQQQQHRVRSGGYEDAGEEEHHICGELIPIILTNLPPHICGAFDDRNRHVPALPVKDASRRRVTVPKHCVNRQRPLPPQRMQQRPNTHNPPLSARNVHRQCVLLRGEGLEPHLPPLPCGPLLLERRPRLGIGLRGELEPIRKQNATLKNSLEMNVPRTQAPIRKGRGHRRLIRGAAKEASIAAPQRRPLANVRPPRGEDGSEVRSLPMPNGPINDATLAVPSDRIVRRALPLHEIARGIGRNGAEVRWGEEGTHMRRPVH